MRILLLSNLFQPEPNHLRGISFAKELHRRGHQVDVLTGFPIYPAGKLYDGYSISWRRREIIEGISITRTAMYPNHDSSGVGRSINYLTHSFSTCFQMPYFRNIPDIVHVYLGPITLTWPAMILRALRGVPFVMDVADLWPDSVSASGMLDNKWMIDILGKLCKWSYSMSSKIVVPSEGFKRMLQERGVPYRKIEYIPHWCDEQNMHFPTNPELSLADNIGFKGYFNVVYAGNMGKVQALGSVLDAAKLIRNDLPCVQFVFIGDGVESQQLKVRVTKENIQNIKFMDAVPLGEIGNILTISDVLLIHLKDNQLGKVSIPQKTQAFMAAGKPILMAVRGDAADLVTQAQAGVLCEPENPESIAEALRHLVGMREERRLVMGMNGRRFYEKELSFRVGIERMESVFKDTLFHDRNLTRTVK